jgi:hypothetical protein
LAFYHGGKAGDEKGHEEEAKGFPEIELDLIFIGGSGAEIQGATDDNAEAEGGKPKPRAGIKVANEHDAIPNEIAPKDQPTTGKIGEVA